MSSEHRLERRSRLLASAITARVEALRDSIASPGERPPFTEHKTEKEAFAWWRAHFNDEYGQRVLERMQPDRVAELRLWLSRMIEAERAGGMV